MDGRRFEGVRCLVTGAADGIGRATARRFAAEGARVLVCDLNAAGLADLGAAAALTLDVAAEDTPQRLMDAVATELGGLDVLVNNAGITGGEVVERMSDDAWRRVLAVNLDAVFRLCRAAIPVLRRSTRGRIVNIGSVMSTLAAPGMGAYTVSKHAIAGLTRTLATELGGDGITANFVLPGAIVTGITRGVFEADPGFRNFWIGKSPLQRLGMPDDVASAILFLASEEASFVTGHGLAVDGGALATP
jgi:NAD(P)-dependent dehydrogenase (short-subunit alcohol dehydrogenase family)